MLENNTQYTIKDLKSPNEIRWCPGCGDHAIINSIQKAMVTLAVPMEKYAVVSGIGCSSRFPYYMNTYGFHTIHGRAAAVASGLKSANPDLSVWEITGDGDALAIGGNHFIHMVRRNIDLNVILFNNKIYGLTKGQYSPTCDRGKVTKTSPFGTVEDPFTPGKLVLGARGTFFARTIDNNVKKSHDIFVEAAGHKGTSVVEVLQNCVIYNHNIHSEITDPKHKEDRQLFLEDGKPMIFGKEKNKGIILNKKGKLEVAVIGENGVTMEDILVHDAGDADGFIHQQLIEMKLPEYPVAFGVIRKVKDLVYDECMEAQIKEVKETAKVKCVEDLLFAGNTWEVK